MMSFLWQASPRDVRLTFQGMMKKRVIRPAVIFCAAIFGSYAIGYYGFGAIYAVLLLLAFMSVEGVLFRYVRAHPSFSYLIFA
jgi:hypothetical protein